MDAEMVSHIFSKLSKKVDNTKANIQLLKVIIAAHKNLDNTAIVKSILAKTSKLSNTVDNLLESLLNNSWYQMFVKKQDE